MRGKGRSNEIIFQFIKLQKKYILSRNTNSILATGSISNLKPPYYLSNSFDVKSLPIIYKFFYFSSLLIYSFS